MTRGHRHERPDKREEKDNLETEECEGRRGGPDQDKAPARRRAQELKKSQLADSFTSRFL